MANVPPDTITVICTANICRSPMAESLLGHALAAEPEPWHSLKVASAGLAAWEGEAVSPNTARALIKVGLDVAKHRSQRITAEMLARSILVLVMTEGHRTLLRESFPEYGGPVMLFRELLAPPADPAIPDPFGGGLDEYESCRDSMVEAIPSLLRHIKTIHPAPSSPTLQP